MRKLLQWCLVAVVAIALIGVVAHQLLTASTERASKISVAALQETLDEFEASRSAPAPKATASTAASLAPKQHPDIATLRSRWRELLRKFANYNDLCPIDYDLESTVFSYIMVDWKDEIDATALEQVREYDACMEAMIAELLFLCSQNTSAWDLFDADLRSDSEEAQWGFPSATSRLEFYIQHKAVQGDFGSAIEAIQALFGFYRIYIDRYRNGDSTKSIIIQKALASGTVDDATWQQLLDSMAARRDPQCLADDVAARTREMLAIYETWPQSVQFTFSEYPLLYSQNWAYRHVTTPLFNHDLETFGRAMDTLIALSKIPYYEATPSLEKFYDEFAVEPSMADMKFIRGNPAWYYVLELSRYHLPYEASLQSIIDTVTLAILLERYKKSTGAYPDTLDVLAPDFGGALPISPLDGQPYVYERTEDRYQLEYRVMADPYVVAHQGMPAIEARTWFQPMANEEEPQSEQ